MCFGEKNMQSVDRKDLAQLLLSQKKTHRRSFKFTMGLFGAIAQRFEHLTCCRMSVSALEVFGTSAITRATIVDPSSQSDDLLGPGTRDFATLGATFHGKIHKCPVSTVAFEQRLLTKPRSPKNEVLVKESETSGRFQKPSPLA